MKAPPTRISANVAEKPKRGRPALHSPGALEQLALLFGPELAGCKDRPRKLRFLAARQEGLSLALKHGLTWIADRKVIAAGGEAQLAVCAELGVMLRSGWAEVDVLAVARALSDEQPPVRVAVDRLRRMRRREPEADRTGSPLELAAALESTLNEYLARNPTMSWLDAAQALDFVAEECRDKALEDTP